MIVMIYIYTIYVYMEYIMDTCIIYIYTNCFRFSDDLT